MPDAEKIQSAEAALKDLEKFTHDEMHANTAYRAALLSGEPEKVEVARGDYQGAVQDRIGSGITQRQIDEAAQAVLDARGEAHTEVNILPPGTTHETEER